MRPPDLGTKSLTWHQANINLISQAWNLRKIYLRSGAIAVRGVGIAAVDHAAQLNRPGIAGGPNS